MTDADRQQLDEAIAHAEAPGGMPVLRAYRDSNGVWTIGLGTNLQELEIDGLTAWKWMRRHRRRCEEEAAREFSWFADASVRRQMAIVELLYNMGLPKVRGFVKMLAACEVGDWQAAAVELLDSKWKSDVGPARSQRIADWLSLG